MSTQPILSRIRPFKAVFLRLWRPSAPCRPDLQTAWQNPAALPAWVRADPTAQRYLDLLDPLAWGQLPERNLQRNWGHAPIPYATFIAAYRVKLHEGHRTMDDLHRFLAERPALTWLLGFPLAVSNPGRRTPGRLDARAWLPTVRHLTHLLRVLPNAVLQVLLTEVGRLIREALLAQGVPTGDCISLDTKHILAWVKENNRKTSVEGRYDKTRQPAGDPDCKLGCKRTHTRRQEPSPEQPPKTPTKKPIPAHAQAPGEFYWGYGSGVIVVKAPGWGEFVLAECTQTFDHADTTYFFPLMAQSEQRLGFKPRWGTFDCAFDAWYVYAYFHRDDDPAAFAAVPFGEKGGYQAQSRHFSPEGLPLCAAGLPMSRKLTDWDRTKAIVEHERGRYGCPLLHPAPTGAACPIAHTRWPKGGCTADMPTSIGTRLRYTLDRDSPAYKAIYKQRSATERINSQAVALGIERPHLRNGTAIANQNTLIYLLINLRFLQRIRQRIPEFP